MEALKEDADVRGNILLLFFCFFLERQLIHIFDCDSQKHYRYNTDYGL